MNKRLKGQWIVAVSLIAAGLLALLAFRVILIRTFDDIATISAKAPEVPSVVAGGIPGGGGLLLLFVALTVSGMILALVTLVQSRSTP